MGTTEDASNTPQKRNKREFERLAAVHEPSRVQSPLVAVRALSGIARKRIDEWLTVGDITLGPVVGGPKVTSANA